MNGQSKSFHVKQKENVRILACFFVGLPNLFCHQVLIFICITTTVGEKWEEGVSNQGGKQNDTAGRKQDVSSV